VLSITSSQFRLTLKYINIGDAINIDEYVPIIIPHINANEKPFKISPPKNK
jgi:hypothetical protein